MFLDKRELVAYEIKLIVETVVNLAQHIVKKETGVFVRRRGIERSLRLENLRKFVQCINRLIPRRDKKILADHKVDLLLTTFVRVFDGGELQNDVDIVGVKFGPCLGGGGDELLRYALGDIEFSRYLAYLERIGGLEINPCDMAVVVPGVHVGII